MNLTLETYLSFTQYIMCGFQLHTQRLIVSVPWLDISSLAFNIKKKKITRHAKRWKQNKNTPSKSGEIWQTNWEKIKPGIILNNYNYYAKGSNGKGRQHARTDGTASREETRVKDQKEMLQVKLPKLAKQREKNIKRQNWTSKNWGTVTKAVAYMNWDYQEKEKKEKKKYLKS